MAHVHSLSSVCKHCGTSLGESNDSDFCCGGCAFVFALLQREGFAHYYSLRDANPPTCPLPVEVSKSDYRFCDDPEFIARLSPDGERLRFFIEGMNCSACLWLLEKLPDLCADAASARVNMSDSTIEVRRTPHGSFAAIARMLNQLGYRPHPLREPEDLLRLRQRERRIDLIRIGIAAACTGNIMILAVSLYGGAQGRIALQFAWLAALLATPALTYCAWPFYKNVWTAWRTRQLNIDVPIVAAIFAGIIASFVNLIEQSSTIYFDSLSMLVFLLLSSRFALKGLQSRQLSSGRLEDELLLSTVTRISGDGSIESVSSLALQAGDIIEIENGSHVPVDGTVVSGSGFINCAVLTGESYPIEVSTSSRIEAGSQKIAGDWHLRVDSIPSETRLARILRDTETAAKQKSHFLHLSDRVAQWFIAIVLAASALLVASFWASDRIEGISRALALIIVTCPCVFGIAIPLSMNLFIRHAARHGIVIKNAEAIEKLWSIKSIFFDKTGTLTTGEISIVGSELGCNTKALQILLMMENENPHPVARAISRHLRERGIACASQAPVQTRPEGGLTTQVDGVTYSIRPMGLSGSLVAPHIPASRFGFFVEDNEVALFELQDQTRTESARLLSWARDRHFRTYMLSGDHHSVVQNSARELGFANEDVWAQANPEKKAQVVQLAGAGTAMIGDGVNDASALASADVGIAICGSLEASLRAADIYLLRPNLHLIQELFEAAKATRTAILRNLTFSVVFNFVSGTLAIAGLMTPLWAAVLMPVSSLTVFLSSLWTARKLFARDRGLK